MYIERNSVAQTRRRRCYLSLREKWTLDGRSFYLVNQAYMVLLPKKKDASSIGDYRPISLIHSIAKLLTKVLARCLALHMKDLVKLNQSAFIRTRLIHENYKALAQEKSTISSYQD